MSDRKESLKKSLGVSEYPWSSGDEEDNAQTNTAPDSLTNNRPTENGDNSQLGTSGTSLFSLSPTRRNQTTTKLERDLFWSLLNNPHRSTAAGPSKYPDMNNPHRSTAAGPSKYPDMIKNLHCLSPSTSSFEPDQTHERGDLENRVANIHRILAIRRINRNLGSNIHKHSYPRSGGSSRNIIFAPALHADMANTMRFGRIKRRPMSRVPPAGCSRNSIIPAVLESPSSHDTNDAPDASAASAAVDAPDIRDAHDATHCDRENSPSMPSLLPENNGDNEQTRENREELAANPVDMAGDDEDEVVDVEGNDIPDYNANTEVAEQARGDDEPNEDMTVQVAESAEVHSLQGQGLKRKRESSKDREPDSVKGFNQSLLQLLECPVCLEWMEPPMSQCRRGHLVCGRCRARLSACPVCRTAFSSVRNRAMEAVAEMLHYPCRHGCGRETRLRRRGTHEASCPARRYRCPAPGCGDRPPLPLADLPQHFRTKHQPLLKMGYKHKFSMKVNSEQHDNWLVMVAHELFHLRIYVDIRTWGMIVYVAYIGPKRNASNYTYKVTITGQHNDRKLVYTRATHSDLESSSLNVSRQDCFHMTLDQALNFLRFKNRFCEPEKFLDFTVEINKREVPVEPAAESDS